MPKKGSDGLNINLGPIAHGDVIVNVDASEVVNLKNELKNTIEVMNLLVKGKDVAKYFDKQAASIDNVVNAAKRFASVKTDTNAENLVASMNAFSAWNPDDDIANYFEEISYIAGASIKEIKELGRGLDSAFSVENLSKSIDVFKNLTEVSSETASVIEKLRQGDTSVLQSQVEELTDKVDILRSRCESLRYELEQYQSGDKFEELTEELDMFRDSAERAMQEFASFLSVVGYAGHDIDPSSYFGRFRDYFDAIRDGAMTSQEAIAKFRREYSGEFNDVVGPNQLTGMLSILDKITYSLDTILAKLEQVGNIGTSDAAGGIEQTMSSGGEAAGRMSDALGDIIGSADSISGLLGVLKELSVGELDVASGAENATSSIESLIKSLTSLSGNGVDSLARVSEVLYGIRTIGDMDVNTRSIDNITNMLNVLGTTSRIDGNILSQLSGLNFKGLSELKVSKASMNNLATYLPQIASVNVGVLESIAKIDWSNLSNLKVSKSSIDSIARLGDISGGIFGGQHLSVDDSVISSICKSVEDAVTKSVKNIKVTVDSAEVSDAAKQDIKSEINAAANEAVINAKPTGIADGGNGSPEDEIDGLEKLIRLYEQYYDLRSKEARDINKNVEANADIYNQRANDIWEQISAIEAESPALAELAGAHERVTAAVRKSQTAINSADAAEAISQAKNQKQSLDELVRKYEEYYSLKSKQISATNRGDLDNADIFRSRAESIWEDISAIERENEALAKLAGENDRVTNAVRKYQETANKGQAISDKRIETENIKKQETELANLVSKYQEFYSLMTKSVNAESAGNLDNAAMFRQMADAIWEEIGAIEEGNPALAELAGSTDKVTQAFKRYQEAVNKVAVVKKAADDKESENNARKQKEELDALIAKYIEYYNLRSEQINATSRIDINNADVFRSRANAIWEEIAAIEAEKPELAELAGENDKVTEAVHRYQEAANRGQIASDKAFASRAEQEAKDLERYRRQLESPLEALE